MPIQPILKIQHHGNNQHHSIKRHIDRCMHLKRPHERRLVLKTISVAPRPESAIPVSRDRHTRHPRHKRRRKAPGRDKQKQRNADEAKVAASEDAEVLEEEGDFYESGGGDVGSVRDVEGLVEELVFLSNLVSRCCGVQKGLRKEIWRRGQNCQASKEEGNVVRIRILWL